MQEDDAKRPQVKAGWGNQKQSGAENVPSHLGKA